MTFPSPEVARAVEASKGFLDWMVTTHTQDFNQAWLQCPNGGDMFKVLVALNPAFKDLHWVSMRSALRVVAEDGDLDEQLLDHLARKKAALVAGKSYDGEAAMDRAISLNRILLNDSRPSKGQAHMAVGWACCKSPRSCGMALESASCAERFRLEERERQGYFVLDKDYIESGMQANDIREFFPLPLTTSKIRYPTRYRRAWVI